MDFYQLHRDSLILETIQAAKNLLVKDYAEKNKKNPKDIPEEIKKTIYNDPKFQKIMNLCKDPSQHNWVYPLTKFYIIDGIDWSLIKKGTNEEDSPGLYDLLVELKQFLKELPLKTVEAYVKVEPSPKDNRPGHEVLWNDLMEIMTKRKLKRLFDSMHGRMKKEFREASSSTDAKDKELIQSLLSSAEIMGTLKPRKAWDKVKKIWYMEDPWEVFGSKQTKYSDNEIALKNNPSFKDPKVAFRALVRDTGDFVSSWGLTLEEIYGKLEKEGPRAKIFYFGDNYLAMSARTPEPQVIVSGDANFCIKTPETFFKYRDGAIQVNILNYNVPKVNPKNLLGVTINKKGVVTACAYRPNSGQYRDFHKEGISYVDFLKGEDYPEEIIRSIIESFEEESLIAETVGNLYKKFQGLDNNAIIRNIMDIKQGIIEGTMSSYEWDRISGTVNFLIKEEKNIPTELFLKAFKASGIFMLKAFQTFDFIVGDDYTKEDMEEIKKSTIEGFDEIKELLKNPYTREHLADDIPIFEKMIKGKEDCLQRIDSYIDLK